MQSDYNTVTPASSISRGIHCPPADANLEDYSDVACTPPYDIAAADGTAFSSSTASESQTPTSLLNADICMVGVYPTTNVSSKASTHSSVSAGIIGGVVALIAVSIIVTVGAVLWRVRRTARRASRPCDREHPEIIRLDYQDDDEMS